MRGLLTNVLPLSMALLGISSSASAQRAPDTATVDRGDGISKFGLDLGLSLLDGPLYDGALRLEPYGQYVLDSGLGFYGAFPITVSFGDEDDPVLGDQDDVAAGNLDVGLLFVRDGATTSWVFRGGVALPTADDDLDGFLTNGAGVWPRLTDVALAEPDATYIRVAVSPLVHTRTLFLRGDLGLDLGIGDDDPDHLVRLNLAGGIDLGAAALSIELATVAALDDEDDDEDVFHTLAFAVRFMTEKLEPFLAVGVPLDESLREGVDLFLSGGIQVPFR